MVRWGDFYQHIFINKNSKAKQSEWRKIIETQSEATRCASLRFVALENFALGIYMPVEDHFNLLEEENVLRPTCILG